MHVLKNQPWVVQNHNILLEVHNPSKPVNQYQFPYLYTNVRLYGIPTEAKTPQRIDDILNQIGHPSDFEEQSEFEINRDELYALAKAELNVNEAAVDKVFVLISPTRRIIVFVHYEKIRRICIFCAAFFHNRADCPATINRVLLDGVDPIDLNHKWMTRVSAIPWEMVTLHVRENTPREIQLSALLTNLRAQYANLTDQAQTHQSNVPLTSALQTSQSRGVNTQAVRSDQPQDIQMVDQQDHTNNNPQHNNDNTVQSMQWQMGQPTQTDAQITPTTQIMITGAQITDATAVLPMQHLRETTHSIGLENPGGHRETQVTEMDQIAPVNQQSQSSAAATTTQINTFPATHTNMLMQAVTSTAAGTAILTDTSPIVTTV